MKKTKIDINQIISMYSVKRNIFKLHGSNNNFNIQRRIDFISLLYKTAVERTNFISNFRQKSFNFALIIFAALFTIGLKDIKIKLSIFSLNGIKDISNNLSIFSSIALLIITIIFCFIDRRFHKMYHAWLATEIILSGIICEIINNPNKDTSFMRYFKYGEKKATCFAMQPIIYYLLIISSALNLIVNILSKLK